MILFCNTHQHMNWGILHPLQFGGCPQGKSHLQCITITKPECDQSMGNRSCFPTRVYFHNCHQLWRLIFRNSLQRYYQFDNHMYFPCNNSVTKQCSHIMIFPPLNWCEVALLTARTGTCAISRPSCTPLLQPDTQSPLPLLLCPVKMK